MEEQFTDGLLLNCGFIKVPESAYIQPLLGSIKEQWSYKQVILTYVSLNSEEYYILCDNTEASISYRIKNVEDLKAYLRFIDKGIKLDELFWLEQERRKQIVDRLSKYPNGMPYLEDFRLNELGTSHFTLKSMPSHKIYNTYNDHSQLAFTYTLQAIGSLENSTDVIHASHHAHSSISFWFLTL